MKKILISVIIAFLLAFSGLISLIYLYKEPQITIQSLKIEKVDKDNINLKLLIRVDNPNIFPIILKKIDYQLDINESKNIAGGLINKGINIHSNAKNIPVEVPLTVYNNKIPEIIASFLRPVDKLGFIINGNAYFNIFFKEIKIPYKYQGYLDLQEIKNALNQYLKNLNSIFFGH